MTTAYRARNLRLHFTASSGEVGYRVVLRSGADNSEMAGGEMQWPGRKELEDRFFTPLRNFLVTPVTPIFQEALGDRLAELLPLPVRDAIMAERLKVAGSDVPLTLGVVGLSKPRWFAALPWEFLRLETTALGGAPEFFGLEAHCNLTRSPEHQNSVEPIRAHPLRVLIVSADPRTPEYPALAHIESEITAIQEALDSRRGGTVVEVIRHTASAALRGRLMEFAPHLVHYIGHGKERATGGVLALHSGAGVEELHGTDLGAWIVKSSARLVVLSACHTASVGLSGNSVAYAVMQAGVPAVLGMQLTMRDNTSRIFSSALYRRLGETGCIVQAVWDARQAVRGVGPDWAVPNLHLAGETGPLFLLEPAREMSPASSGSAQSTAPPLKSNLPAPLDRFIGRRDERRELIALLKKQLTRCVTLIGAAGAGKTRLAAQVGAAAQAFASVVVVFVELQDVGEPDRILAQIADALSLDLAPGAGSILHSILRVLDGRRALLILDNFEHVRSAAVHVRTLLEKLPKLQVLVTSREPLNIPGEYKISLDPLKVPPVGAGYREINTFDSVRLLAERAKYANHRFALTAENAADAAAICRALDGLPLGIEIVAAQIRNRPIRRVLSDLRTELLDTKSRIAGLPARQQSLRAAFDWSFERLAEAERTLFMQLSLFETAFSEEDVCEVCSGDHLGSLLECLRDRSLLHYDPQDAGRPYRLLVPVREYASGHLGRPEGVLRSRFIAAFTLRAGRLSGSYFENQMKPVALEAFRRDLENFRSAWRMTVEGGQQQAIADLGLAAVSFAPMLLGRSNFDDWMDPIEQALRSLGSDPRLARLYNIRARLASIRGDFALALECQQTALTLFTGAAADAQAADALSTLAWFAMRARDYDAAVRHSLAAIPQARAVGNTEAEAVALCVLARSSMSRDISEAESYARRSLELFRLAKVARGEAHANMALGSIADLNEDADSAEQHYIEAIRLCWEQRDEIQTLQCLDVLAKLRAARQPGPLAARLLADVAHLQRIIGLPEAARQDLPDTDSGVRYDRPKTVGDVVNYVCSDSAL